jgi:hypothetical protein
VLIDYCLFKIAQTGYKQAAGQFHIRESEIKLHRLLIRINFDSSEGRSFVSGVTEDK